MPPEQSKTPLTDTRIKNLSSSSVEYRLEQIEIFARSLEVRLGEAMEDTKRLIKLADMIWDGRWMDDKNHLPEMDVEYQTLVGIAAEIRSGNYTMIDVAVAEHGTLIRAQKLIGEKDV